MMQPRAVYLGDNGRMQCVDCAGYTARVSLRDLRGATVDRITVDDVRAWPSALRPLSCACRRVRLSALAGVDGCPLPVR
jgi:hypothetical protein